MRSLDHTNTDYCISTFLSQQIVVVIALFSFTWLLGDSKSDKNFGNKRRNVCSYMCLQQFPPYKMSSNHQSSAICPFIQVMADRNLLATSLKTFKQHSQRYQQHTHTHICICTWRKQLTFRTTHPAQSEAQREIICVRTHNTFVLATTETVTHVLRIAQHLQMCLWFEERQSVICAENLFPIWLPSTFTFYPCAHASKCRIKQWNEILCDDTSLRWNLCGPIGNRRLCDKQYEKAFLCCQSLKLTFIQIKYCIQLLKDNPDIIFSNNFIKNISKAFFDWNTNSPGNGTAYLQLRS